MNEKPVYERYEAPIKLIMGEMRTSIENEVLKVCQQYAPQVDETELIRALEYDRDQYNKGRQDAVNNVKLALTEIEETLGGYQEYLDVKHILEQALGVMFDD